MNTILLLLIILALIIILISLVLYNGLKIELITKKEGKDFNFKLTISLLKIELFKKEYPSTEDSEDELEDEEDTEEDSEEDLPFEEKLNNAKPLLKDLKESKKDIKDFLIKIFKSTDFKKLNGSLKLGLKDPTRTARINGWIWGFNALANTYVEPLYLDCKPVFDEEIIEFDIHMISRINLLGILIKAIQLLRHKNIRKLIRDGIDYHRGNPITEED